MKMGVVRGTYFTSFSVAVEVGRPPQRNSKQRQRGATLNGRCGPLSPSGQAPVPVRDVVS
ncbi:MAG: hypothetical protein KatS3mg050_4012 [Litorilinea sp.]|nr:MAG: hypothetical protein KatS3mg050_4012 [Litorilinea sp.]